MTTQTTPASIPAEDIAAHHTEYVPTMPLSDIQPHPRNIRHNAIADDELVGSIRTQGLLEPLLVAPHPDTDIGGYVLIAGHRRLDGLTRAGHTFAPALIRYDLTDEGDQVAAMLVENGRRADLTPIEEAEGFDVLIGEGWKVDRIAEKTGYSKSTVTARRKLTSLKPTFQEQVSAGQVTIEQAIAIAALPEAEQTRLSSSTGSNLQYELRRSEERVRRTTEVLAEIAGLKQRGVTEQEMPKGMHLYGLNDADHGLTPLAKLGGDLRYASGHNGCLAFVNTGTTQYPGIDLVCINVSRHDDEIAATQAAAMASRSEEEKAADERQAKAEQEREEARRAAAELDESRRIASQLRADVILGGRGVTKPPADAVSPLIRYATISFLNQVGIDDQLFETLADIPDEDRWTGGRPYSNRAEYYSVIADMPTAAVWRTFLAASIANIEALVHDTLVAGDVEDTDDAVVLDGYLAALATLGHHNTPVDDDLAAILASPTELEDGQ